LFFEIEKIAYFAFRLSFIHFRVYVSVSLRAPRSNVVVLYVYGGRDPSQPASVAATAAAAANPSLASYVFRMTVFSRRVRNRVFSS
jgi:hypothetical protein